MKKTGRAVLAVLIGAASVPLSAQERTEFSGTALCGASCIAVDTVQTIPAPDSVSLGREDLFRTVVDRTGRAFIAPSFLPGRVLVFRDGQLSGTLGGYGEGPSEARRVSHLAVGVADSIHVFKPLGRNVFDSDGRFVRYQRDPVLPMESNVAIGNREVHAAFSPGQTTPRPPLVLLPPAGGASGATLDLLDDPGPDASRGARRILDRASSGCLAVGRAGEYRIDLYDESLALRHVLERTVPWFERWEEWVLPVVDPPAPRVVSVMADCTDGVVWVAISVAEDTDFTPLDLAGREDPLSSESRTYDTIVEVLDVATGQVLASRRFDSGIGPFNEGGFVLEPFVGQGGEQQFRVLRLTLVD